MSIAHNKEQSMHGPVQQKIHKIVGQLDSLLGKLSKASDVPHLQQDIEASAKQIISIINAEHSKIVKLESYLKNAIIDLTEIPVMQPEMQKIAFQAGIKAAIDNLQLFLANSSGI